MIEILPAHDNDVGDHFVVRVNGNLLVMRFATYKSAEVGTKIPMKTLAERWAVAEAGDGLLDLEDLDGPWLN